MADGLRVAFFGGSFDPPHRGHLAVARAARAALALDAVLFAPVGAQPLKPQGSTAGFDDRLAMTRLAIAADPTFAVSLADAPNPGGAPNYTIDTLRTLHAELPAGSLLFCLMGADSFFALRHWHRGAEIPLAAPLIVASRPGQSLADLSAGLPAGLSIDSPSDPNAIETPLPGGGFATEVRVSTLRNDEGATAPLYLLPGLHVEISASQIRREIRSGIRAELASPGHGSSAAIYNLLPRAVSEYIAVHDLYL